MQVESNSFSSIYTYDGIADWTNREEDPSDVNVWEDNWDDDNVEDDFSVQLKSELESQGVAMEQS